MLHKTRGIVLHTTEYSESSIIASIFTAQFGVQSYIVNSVRSRRAKTKSSLFQPLTIVDLVVYHKADKGLQRIAEINAGYKFSSLPYDIVKSSIAIFLAEVLYRCIREEEPHTSLFEFTETAIKFMDMHDCSFSNFPMFLLIQITYHLGSYPSGEYSEQSQVFNLQEGVFQNTIPNHIYYTPPDVTKTISEIIKSGFNSFDKIKITTDMRSRAFNALITFYELHHTHGTRLKSQKILSEIFSD